MYHVANPCTTRSTLNSCTTHDATINPSTPCQTVNSCIVRAMPSHAQSPGLRSCRHAHSRGHFLPIHLNFKTSCPHPMLCQHTRLRSAAVTPRGAHILWLAFVHGVPLSINIQLRPRLASTLDLWKDTALTAAPTPGAHCALPGSSRLQEGQPYRPPGVPLKFITDQVPGNPDPVPRFMTPLKSRVLPTCVLFNFNTVPDNQMSNNP